MPLTELSGLTERLKGGRRGLRLLVLFGSRARGDAHAHSDWDFGYVGDESLDVAGLMATLVETLGVDEIDLVDLTRANAQLRYRAAADGLVIHERERDAFHRFWFEAVTFWCDMGAILRRGYEDVLGRLAS